MKKKSRQFILAVFVLALTAVAVLTAGCTPKPTEQDVQQTPSTQESLSAKDMTVEEMLKHLKLDGVEVGLPCKVKDLPKTIELRNGYNLTEGRAVGYLYYKNEKIGAAHFDEFSEMADSLKEIDMSTGYEEEVIYGFSFDRGVSCYEIMGVTCEDTKDMVIQKIGYPTISNSEYHISYECIGDVRGSFWGLFFDLDGTMMSCIIMTKKQEEATNE